MSDATEQTTTSQIFKLANRIIGIISGIFLAMFFIILGLIIFYGYLIVNQSIHVSDASGQFKELIFELWRQIIPYASQLIRLIGPIFVLIFALGVLHRLGRNGASPFESSKLLSDLPSTLALLIIATICLLPLAGLEVPDVLNNIALVVVGFYFGKRTTSDE